MKFRKAEISIQIIFSILISLVAVIILLSLLVRSPTGKRFYCKARYTLSDSLDNETYTQCKQFMGVSLESIELEDKAVTYFSNRRIKKVFFFEQGVLRDKTSFSIPIDANGIQADITLETKGKVLHTFSDGLKNTSYYFPPGVHTKTFYISVKPFDEITTFSFLLWGDNRPDQADLVFGLDTSASMSDEWSALCDTTHGINGIIKDLSEQKVNISSKIYGIGEGSTFGFCKEDDLSKSDLSSVLPPGVQLRKFSMNNLIEISPGIKVTHPSDDYNEAWGLAALWAITKYPWRDGAKKLFFPISDSDPTGARATTYNEHTMRWSDPKFSEDDNEQAIIDEVIAQNDLAYIFPVYGDLDPDSLYPEGFNVGSTLKDCYSIYSDTCGTILDWMKAIAYPSGGNITSFSDTQKLKEDIIAAVFSSFPSDLAITIGNTQVWSYPQELNHSNSPKVITVEQSALGEINDYIRNCGPGECLVPITLSTQTDGLVLLQDLDVFLKERISNVGFSIGDHKVIKIPELNSSNLPFNLRFTEQLERYLRDDCFNEVCEIPLQLDVGNPGKLIFQDLKVTYERFPLKEALFRLIYDCWERSRRGQSQQSFLCDEITLPESLHVHPAAVINEESMTSYLIKRKICHVFPNNYNDQTGKVLSCGDRNRLLFQENISDRTNILIEYDGQKVTVG